MAPNRLISGGRRRAHCGIALGAIVLGACETPPQSTGMPPQTGGMSGTAGAAGSGGTIGIIPPVTGGASGTAGVLSTGPNSGLQPIPLGAPLQPSVCASVDDGDTGEAGAGGAAGAPSDLDAGTPDATAPDAGAAALFCDQMVWNGAPAHRVLYTWTTPEQIAELRRDRVLLTRTETPGLGRGYAFTAIDELARRGGAPENQLLAKLSLELFQKVRYAWPHPWATRMGWPGEDYGDGLVRVVLKPEAWIVVVHDKRGMAVIDLENQVVPVTEALAHPERIAAVYFVRTDVVGDGSFYSCGGGYREFVIGNEAMIEEWSIATDAIRARLEEDIERVDAFVEHVRAVTTVPGSREFNTAVACNWDQAPGTDLDVYARSLAIPSEHYLPRAAEIVAIADALRASVPALDPLIVEPGG